MTTSLERSPREDADGRAYGGGQQSGVKGAEAPCEGATRVMRKEEGYGS